MSINHYHIIIFSLSAKSPNPEAIVVFVMVRITRQFILSLNKGRGHLNVCYQMTVAIHCLSVLIVVAAMLRM